jgi:hypothetical protein
MSSANPAISELQTTTTDLYRRKKKRSKGRKLSDAINKAMDGSVSGIGGAGPGGAVGGGV